MFGFLVIFQLENILRLYFPHPSELQCATWLHLYNHNTLPACPSPVSSINLDLSREHVSSPGQRILCFFLTVWLHSTGPQGRLLTGWAPIHMICLFARRAPAALEETRRLLSTTVHCQTAKERDGESFGKEGIIETRERKGAG